VIGVPARHILIPIHDFSAGGTELIAFRLARHWLGAGRQVSILAGAADGPLRSRVPEGAPIHILAPQRPRAATSRLFLGNHMAPVAHDLAPDAIFIPGNFHFILARALRRALPQAAILAKISNPLLPPAIDRAALSWLARPALRALTSGVDRLAAMSRGLTIEAKAQLGHGRVSTLYDPNIADGARIDFMQRPAARPGAPLRLLAIGRLEPQKDFGLALETVAHLRKFRPVHLRICGEGPMRARLERRVDALGLRDSVTLVGFSNGLDEEFRAADLLLITSRYEGGPAVAVEGLAHGVPLVSTDCSLFLRDLMVSPSFGRLVASRSPAALAGAIDAQAALAGPHPNDVAPALAPVQESVAARAYLDLLDRLVSG